MMSAPTDPPELYASLRHSRHTILAAKFISTLFSSLSREDQEEAGDLNAQISALMGRGESYAGDPAMVAAYAGLRATVLKEGHNASLMDIGWFDMFMGKVQLNSFKIEVDNGAHLPDNDRWRDVGVGLYEHTSKINHSCTPNAQVVFGASPASPAIASVVASQPIAPGEELTISYCSQDDPYDQRQWYLARAYGFSCTCPLCLSQQPAPKQSKQ